MKNLKHFAVSLAAALALFTVALGPLSDSLGRWIEQPLQAQTYVHNTTFLAAAQGVSDTTISLNSSSAAAGSSFGAVQVGQLLMVDQELESITGTTATATVFAVQRRGARVGHVAGASVFIGPSGSFQGAPPPAGACTAANVPKYWIVIGGNGNPGIYSALLGQIYTCGGGFWQQSSSPWYDGGIQSGNGATVTLQGAMAGTSALFDRAAGIIYTLPPPLPGMVFDFFVTTTITSNNAEVATNAGTVFIQGLLHVGIAGGATGSDWQCNGTSHIAIKMNGTTSGGILGSWVRFTAVSTTLWNVSGLVVGSGTEVTPCSTTT